MRDDFQKNLKNNRLTTLVCFVARPDGKPASTFLDALAAAKGSMAYLDNIAVFVRVVELGNLSAAGRDMRISPAVASNRIKELEKHLGVRLFNRTTRQLTPTEHGTVFYSGAKQVLEAVDRGRSRGQRAVRPAARHDPRHRPARPRPPAHRLRHSRFPRQISRHRGAAEALGP